MKFDLFLSDFDGTLGCNPDYIDLDTVKAIKEYEEKGGIFTIVTGRSFASIRGICKKYGLKGKVVSFQGSTIADIESGDYILKEGVPLETALEIIRQIKKDGYLSELSVFIIRIYALCRPDKASTPHPAQAPC